MGFPSPRPIFLLDFFHTGPHSPFGEVISTLQVHSRRVFAVPCFCCRLLMAILAQITYYYRNVIICIWLFKSPWVFTNYTNVIGGHINSAPPHKNNHGQGSNYILFWCVSTIYFHITMEFKYEIDVSWCVYWWEVLRPCWQVNVASVAGSKSRGTSAKRFPSVVVAAMFALRQGPGIGQGAPKRELRLGTQLGEFYGSWIFMVDISIAYSSIVAGVYYTPT